MSEIDININDDSEDINIHTDETSNNVSESVGGDPYYTDLAREWATKEGSKVLGIDYSSKHYAGEAKADREHIDNIITDNIDAINTLEANIDTITAVANDLDNIDNAIVSAENAEIWAEGTDEEVQELGGTHSAKVWAENVAQDLTTKVNKSGDTMTGNLTIAKTTPALYLKDTSQTAGTSPSDAQLGRVVFYDSNNNTVGYIQNQYDTNGARRMFLNCRNADGSASTSFFFGYNSQGNFTSSIETPAAGSNDTNIATTAWVRGYAADKTLSNVASIDAGSAVYTALAGKQETLVAGTNIKTINNESLLGSGNINISGGGTVDQTFDGTSQNAQSGVAIQGKLTNYVTTNTNQNITGDKNFTNGLITSGITCNNSTFAIGVNNKLLIGCSSSEINIGNGNRTITFLPPSTQTRPYWGSSNNTLALSSDIPSTANFVTNSSLTTTLSDYATLNWVGQQGYLTASALNGYATETWVTNKGYLTSVSSSDVTTALGYTPVKKAGDTMTGQLKVKKSGTGIQYVGSDFDFSQTPASNVSGAAFQISDQNENRMVRFEYNHLANGGHYLSISDKKNASENDYASIIIGYNSGGIPYATAPVPSANSNSDNIATTKWVKDFAKTSGSNYMSTFSQGTAGYYKFTNGLIIQWGQLLNVSGLTDVTFPTAFTSTNYWGYAIYFDETSATGGYGWTSDRTTTGCKFRLGSSSNPKRMYLVIGY